MNGYFYDAEGQLVYRDEVGPGLADPSVPRPGVVTRTRTPIMRSTRTPLPKIGGNPNGTWESIKTWWTGLPTWQKGAVIGVPVIAAIAIAASQKGEGKSSSIKRI